MTYDEAILDAQKGLTIRRKSWRSYKQQVMKCNGYTKFTSYRNGSAGWYAKPEDREADDWCSFGNERILDNLEEVPEHNDYPQTTKDYVKLLKEN